MSTDIFFANDKVSLSSRTITAEGYLVAPGVLARTGIQEYRAFELGIKDGDPMRMIKLYRPDNEVFDAASMATFDGCPVTIDHPKDGVTKENWAQLTKGEVKGIKREGDHMIGTLTIKSKDAINALEKGKRELSNGYTFTLDMRSGVTPSGEKYDGVQRNIRGNHVALVDAARCGSACRVSDSLTMKGKKSMTDMRKITVDGIPVEVSETAAVCIEKLTAARDKAVAALKDAPDKAAFDKLGADYKQLQASVTAKDAEIAALKKEVITPEARDAMVGAWAKLIEDGKRLMPALVTDGKTCHALRKEVLGSIKDEAGLAAIKAVIGDKKLADLTESEAKTAFAVVAAIKPVAAGDGVVAAAFSGGSAVKVADARALWAANFNNVKE